MGNTVSVSYGGNLDVQVIQVSSSGSYVWSDGTYAGNNPLGSKRGVRAVATNQPIGGLLCADGYTLGEVCSVRIDAVNQTLTANGHSTFNTVRAHQTGGLYSAAPGDSGAPIYSLLGSTNTVGVYGMILGGTVNAPSNVIYYEPASYILAQYAQNGLRVLEQ